jgi:hypothetical protein
MIYTSNDAVQRNEVPFGVPNACKNFHRVHFPQKRPKIGLGLGISSLEVSVNNSSTAQVSSIVAACQKIFKKSNKITKHSSLGTFSMNAPDADFKPKHLVKITFSPVQMILTSNIPIDSTQQAETHGNIKYFRTFILREQPAIATKIPP